MEYSSMGEGGFGYTDLPNEESNMQENISNANEIETSVEYEPLPVIVGSDGTIYARQEGDEWAEEEPISVTAYAEMLSDVSGQTGVAFDKFPKSAKAGMLASVLAAIVTAGAALAPGDAHAQGTEFQAVTNQSAVIAQDPTNLTTQSLQRTTQMRGDIGQYEQAKLKAAQLRAAAVLQAAQQAQLPAAQFGVRQVVGHGNAYPNTSIQGGVSIHGAGGSYVIQGMIRK